MKLSVSQELPRPNILPLPALHMKTFSALLCFFGRLRWLPRVIPTTIPASILNQELCPVLPTANGREIVSPWGNF